MPVFKANYLRRLSVTLFEKMGVPRDVAKVVSNSIVENCLYGHDSHGMILIPRFIKDIETGKIKPDVKPEVIEKTACTARLNGHRGFGQVTMIEAMKTAIALACETGVSAVTVTNSNHVGILWTYAKMAVDKGMLGLIWCVSGPEGGGGLVAPPGGKKKAIGANPIAVGIPAGKMSPLILDISTSVAAGGKIMLYAQQGRKIPLGWLLDEKGNPTRDPNEYLKGGKMKQGKISGTLLPMAGYKGFGLGLTAEILGGLLTGYGASHMTNFREGQGMFIIIIDINKFLPLNEFRKQVDALFRHVKSVPKDSKTKEILIPGELEYRTKKERERDGIPVTDPVWADINAIARKMGVDVERVLNESG